MQTQKPKTQDVKTLSPYMNRTYLYGRIATILSILVMIGIPVIICTVYDMWPPLNAVFSVAGPLLALYVPTALAEQLSMIPMGGNTCYINSIMGNVSNLKFPCYLSALNSVDATPGTETADVMGMIAVTVSGMVTMLVILVGLILIVPLEPLLKSETVTTAMNYIMPALYGSMAVSSFISTTAGPYQAPQKPLIAVIDLALVFAFNAFVFDLTGNEGYAMLVMLIVSVALAYVLYKKGVITLTWKEQK